MTNKTKITKQLVKLAANKNQIQTHRRLTKIANFRNKQNGIVKEAGVLGALFGAGLSRVKEMTPFEKLLVGVPAITAAGRGIYNLNEAANKTVGVKSKISDAKRNAAYDAKTKVQTTKTKKVEKAKSQTLADNNERDNTLAGAGIGAAGGSAIGAMMDGGHGALAGAGVGGLAGGFVGNQYGDKIKSLISSLISTKPSTAVKK